MKPNRIILIRHGHSQGNFDKEIYHTVPDYALKLTENGIAQAAEAGRQLKEIIKDESMKFYVSPFWRARMTFEEIARHFDKTKIKWVEEPRLREQDWGHLRNPENTKKIERERDAYGTFYFRFPDGESCADVFDRVSDFLGSFHRDFEKVDYPKNAIVVIHGMTIRLFLMRWFHWSVEAFEQLQNPDNCNIIVLEKNIRDKYDLKSEVKKHQVKHSYQRPVSI